jgi:phage terminase large subunit-like protein
MAKKYKLMDRTKSYKDYIDNISKDNPFYGIVTSSKALESRLGREISIENAKGGDHLSKRLNLEEGSTELKIMNRRKRA